MAQPAPPVIPSPPPLRAQVPGTTPRTLQVPATDYVNLPSVSAMSTVAIGARGEAAMQSLETIVEHSWSNGSDVDIYRERYDKSLETIKQNIFAVAGALTTLDAIESKLLLIQSELNRIKSANKRIDCDKVEIALRRVTDYVNDAISRIDDQCVNLLRDAKMEIRFTELNSADAQTAGFELTMISPESFFQHKLARAAEHGLVEEEIPVFIDGLKSIVSTNIHILSSILLVLFATRDYTQAVTRLASREGIIPQIDVDPPAIANGAATLDRLRFEQVDRGAAAGMENLRQGSASLTELLKKVRENRTEYSLPSPGNGAA